MTRTHTRTRGSTRRLRSTVARWLAVLTAGTVLATSAGPATAESHTERIPGSTADAVVMWNGVVGQASVACNMNPLHEGRIFTLLHIAIHDALNAIDLRSEPYAFATKRRLPAASPDAAVAGAAFHTLMAPIFGLPAAYARCLTDAVDAAYAPAIGGIPAGWAKDQGLLLGQAAAAAILAARTGDGSDTEVAGPDLDQGTRPGEYRAVPACPPPAPASCTTPAGFQFAPDWGDVDPFSIRDSSQFAPRRPYPVASRRYAEDYEEVRRLGAIDSSDRTADETQTAYFWYENSPMGWNRIARTVVGSDPGLTAWDAARLFGVLNIAMADGYIGNFETRRVYDRWRPVTAIREGDRDGNADTEGDATWTPLLRTPPLPGFDSGHSLEGAAAAEVMKSFFGTDRMTFSTCSMSMPAGSTCVGDAAVYRTFASFSEAARENSASRIFAGIHFRQETTEGERHGRRIADFVMRDVMRPVS